MVTTRTIKISLNYSTMQLVEDLKGHAVIAGGYARWAALGRSGDRPSDIDLFLAGIGEGHTKVVWEVLRDRGYRLNERSSLATTWVNDDRERLPLQVVEPLPRANGKFAYGSPATVLDSFDFTCVQAAIITPYTALISASFERDNQEKVLRIHDVHTPIGTTKRIAKYVARGFSIDRSEIVRLFDHYASLSPDERIRAIYYND